jgi:hypothetical protein
MLCDIICVLCGMVNQMKKCDVVYVGGFSWRRYPDSKNASDRRYYKSCAFGKVPKYLHRWVWEQHYGEIPKGFEIHHKDEDTGNNSIDNLDCVSREEHNQLHCGKSWGDRNALFVHLEKIRPLSKAWHSSKDGLAHHREIGALSHKSHIPVDKKCENCGIEFKSKQIGNIDKFCSNKCKSAWRRASGIDNVQKECVVCKSLFVLNKYAKTLTCSRRCGVVSRNYCK